MNKLVKITWVDSSNYNVGWHNDVEFDLVHIVTIGLVISETEEYIAISHSVGQEESNYDVFVIPKGCIKEVVELDPNPTQVSK